MPTLSYAPVHEVTVAAATASPSTVASIRRRSLPTKIRLIGKPPASHAILTREESGSEHGAFAR
jgi:hypothetical protein